MDKPFLVGFDFSIFKDFDLEVYGAEEYLADYWFGDAAAAKSSIEKSSEKQFHIGFEFADIPELMRILDSVLKYIP